MRPLNRLRAWRVRGCGRGGGEDRGRSGRWTAGAMAEVSATGEASMADLAATKGFDPESRVFIFRHRLAIQLKTLDSGCHRSGSGCAPA